MRSSPLFVVVAGHFVLGQQYPFVLLARCRSTESSPVATARRAIAACNVARYSES